MATKKKYYIMKNGSDVSIFTGRQPRQAALKAATRGFKEIKLRERGRRNRDGTYSVHVFKGARAKVTVEDTGSVNWLPAKVWKPSVKKMKVDRIETIKDF